MMKSPSNASVELLSELGHAIDNQQPVFVFDGGRVGFRGVEQDKDFDHDRLSPGSHRRWQRQSRQRQGISGPRSSAKAHHIRTGADETDGIGFRVLAQHYAALKFEDREGLWVVVRSIPLGELGPQVHFLIGVPFHREIMPRAWAFGAIGPAAHSLPLRHTNFPDASVCAFTQADNAWSRDEGLLPLVDHYSMWVIKKWHHQHFGWWPGPQSGACALYRKKEFSGAEWCGCGSGKRYRDCHQASDMLANEEIARLEFRRLFLCDYEIRMPPDCIMAAAQSRWKNLPSLALAFSYRRLPGEPLVSF